MSPLVPSVPGRWRSAWREHWSSWRDTLLSSPRFRRQAAAFLPTRPIARRRARDLFDLVAGFVYSQILLACVRLRLFDILAEGPQTSAALARRLALPHESTERLLAAAVALRLVERRHGERYGLGELGAPMVGNRAITAMVEHHAALYADLADPVALLRSPDERRRSGALADLWPYAAKTGAADGPTDRADSLPERAAQYSALMAASQPLVADDILDTGCLRQARCLLDVGGGDGSFLIAAAARHASLELMLFDLPEVAGLAQARLSAAGLGARSRVVAGSFLVDALPVGADVVSLVRVVHDHDDHGAMVLLRAAHRCLPRGGRLLLAEPMAGTSGAEAMGDAYFGFYLLAMGRGRPRTAQVLMQMLEAAGFEAAHPVATRMPLQTQLVSARRA